MSQGGLSPRVNWKALAKYEFALPPLEEQRRIAEGLQGWLATENAVRDAESSLELCKASLLDEIFHPEDSRRVLSKIADDPAGEWIRLGDICNLQAGYAFKSAEYSESGDRLLRGSNVAVDATSWEPAETKFWPEDRREEFSDFILHEDDMVIAMDRPFIGSGFKVARLNASDLPALLLQRVGRFQVRAQEHKEAVWAFLHSRSFHVQLLAQQEGTDLPHISKAQIENTILPLSALQNEELVDVYTHLSRTSARLKERVAEIQNAAKTNLEAALR
jgi:type I restriction enzyme, S subunit